MYVKLRTQNYRKRKQIANPEQQRKKRAITNRGKYKKQKFKPMDSIDFISEQDIEESQDDSQSTGDLASIGEEELDQLFCSISKSRAWESDQTPSDRTQSSSQDSSSQHSSTIECNSSQTLQENEIAINGRIYEIKECLVTGLETQNITDGTVTLYDYTHLTYRSNSPIAPTWQVKKKDSDHLEIKKWNSKLIFNTPNARAQVFFKFKTILPYLFEIYGDYMEKKLVTERGETKTCVNVHKYIKNYNSNKGNTNIKNLGGLAKELETAFQSCQVDFLNFIRYFLTRRNAQQTILNLVKDNTYRKRLMRSILANQYPSYSKRQLAKLVLSSQIRVGFLDNLKRDCKLDFLFCSSTISKYIQILFEKVRKTFQIRQLNQEDSFSVFNLNKAIDLYKKKASILHGEEKNIILQSTADASGFYSNNCITTHGFLFHSGKFVSQSPSNLILTNVFVGKDTGENMKKHIPNSQEMRNLLNRSDIETMLGVYDYGFIFGVIGYHCAFCGQRREEWDHSEPETPDSTFTQTLPVPIQEAGIDLLHLIKNVTMNVLVDITQGDRGEEDKVVGILNELDIVVEFKDKHSKESDKKKRHVKKLNGEHCKRILANTNFFQNKVEQNKFDLISLWGELHSKLSKSSDELSNMSQSEWASIDKEVKEFIKFKSEFSARGIYEHSLEHHIIPLMKNLSHRGLSLPKISMESIEHMNQVHQNYLRKNNFKGNVHQYRSKQVDKVLHSYISEKILLNHYARELLMYDPEFCDEKNMDKTELKQFHSERVALRVQERKRKPYTTASPNKNRKTR
jgi:hypothetical protein